MKLEFQLLVIDDNPGSVSNAVDLLRDHLESRGFDLKCHAPNDLSDDALKQLARKNGREFDLVAIDFNLGRDDTNGANAASRLRHELQFTDMVFYSSNPQVNLLEELAKQGVAGVFIAQRTELDDALRGLADTVIGKAIDLNHMRGIAMAEVAEMDVLMEEALERAFESGDECLEAKGRETVEKLLEASEKRLQQLKELIDNSKVNDIVTDSLLFTSANRYQALNRVAKCLGEKPAEALDVLKDYDPDILQNRNTLAHAKADEGEDGTHTLRAIKRGKDPVTITEEWMTDFRGKLRTHRMALETVCNALDTHIAASKAT